jgi:hypothetical protein
MRVRATAAAIPYLNCVLLAAIYFASLVACTKTESPTVELSQMIETFMFAAAATPDWETGAGPDTPQMKWSSSGIEAEPNCGTYAACRKGETRVLINGKEMQQLRQRLEPIPWKLFMYSTELGKFGPQAISIYPACDAVQCTFDLTNELTRTGFKLTELCDASKFGSSKTALLLQKGSKSSYMVLDKSVGSGGESISLNLLFAKPGDVTALCALDF